MGRRIFNTGWCWEDRCQECSSCTGRPILRLTFSGVIDNDCGNCGTWNKTWLIEQTATCTWEILDPLPCAETSIEFGLTKDFPNPGDLTIEVAVFEDVGFPDGIQLIGDYRVVLSGLNPNEINCDEEIPLMTFVKSAWTINNGDFADCQWDLGNAVVSLHPCENRPDEE